MTDPILHRRSVIAVILFTLITGGIYGVYWIYITTRDLNEFTGDYRIKPGWTLLFGLLTCGLYMFYWWYKINDLIMAAQIKAQRPFRSDNKLLFVVLRIFGLAIINMAIVQSDLNDIYTNLHLAQTPQNEIEDDDEWSDY
ncbi:hypothetical protein EsVE80_11480 [Enterococcus saigonensis]|uniref:DUF4234 domain-containing protein n=1 Tax=Enterococcus saigonensis TaxID=1805431 RepID=A0A679IJG2_9ENTE|nr:DUF4234 domain-containing protein [Enterococcus saigonensis]BCA85625.1 hypothetical protein EsVE80_11480 [Enterococcus saigonensis]